MNITIFSVGIGSGINQKELKDIASESIEDHVTIVDQFFDLNSFVDKISYGSCQEPVAL
jgi:hypothetical protein